MRFINRISNRNDCNHLTDEYIENRLLGVASSSCDQIVGSKFSSRSSSAGERANRRWALDWPPTLAVAIVWPSSTELSSKIIENWC